MDQFAQSAATGLTQLQQLGIAGLFLSLLLLGGVYAIQYFAVHCEKRTDAAIDAYKEEAGRSREVVDKNTEAFQGVQIALAKLEGKFDK